jgi:hypothetical protein
MLKNGENETNKIRKGKVSNIKIKAERRERRGVEMQEYK